MTEFFAMGGYAAFIWPCYGASLLVLCLLAYFSVSAHSRAKQDVQELEKQMGKRHP